jgi:hypothetical protein
VSETDLSFGQILYAGSLLNEIGASKLHRNGYGGEAGCCNGLDPDPGLSGHQLSTILSVSHRFNRVNRLILYDPLGTIR